MSKSAVTWSAKMAEEDTASLDYHKVENGKLTNKKLKLSGAKTRWRENPTDLYLFELRLAGSAEDIKAILTVIGKPDYDLSTKSFTSTSIKDDPLKSQFESELKQLKTKQTSEKVEEKKTEESTTEEKKEKEKTEEKKTEEKEKKTEEKEEKKKVEKKKKTTKAATAELINEEKNAPSAPEQEVKVLLPPPEIPVKVASPIKIPAKVASPVKEAPKVASPVKEAPKVASPVKEAPKPASPVKEVPKVVPQPEPQTQETESQKEEAKEKTKKKEPEKRSKKTESLKDKYKHLPDDKVLDVTKLKLDGSGSVTANPPNTEGKKTSKKVFVAGLKLVANDYQQLLDALDQLGPELKEQFEEKIKKQMAPNAAAVNFSSSSSSSSTVPRSLGNSSGKIPELVVTADTVFPEKLQPVSTDILEAQVKQSSIPAPAIQRVLSPLSNLKRVGRHNK